MKTEIGSGSRKVAIWHAMSLFGLAANYMHFWMTGTWLGRMIEGHWCNFGIAYLQVMNYNVDIHKNNISKGKKDKILKGDKK